MISLSNTAFHPPYRQDIYHLIKLMLPILLTQICQAGLADRKSVV